MFAEDTMLTDSDRFVATYLADYFSRLTPEQLDAINERKSIQNENDGSMDFQFS